MLGLLSRVALIGFEVRTGPHVFKAIKHDYRLTEAEKATDGQDGFSRERA
jgi:hypothetical protein